MRAASRMGLHASAVRETCRETSSFLSRSAETSEKRARLLREMRTWVQDAFDCRGHIRHA